MKTMQKDKIYLVTTLLSQGKVRFYRVVKVINDYSLYYEVVKGKFTIERTYMTFDSPVEMLEKGTFSHINIGYVELRPHTSIDSFWRQLILEAGIKVPSNSSFKATAKTLYISK
jgi:hypothetical protein